VIWNSGDPLPNAVNAEIDRRKFTEYSMNPNNPNNQDKWMAFAALGYDLRTAPDRAIAAQAIIAPLRQAILTAPALPGKISPHGLRFKVATEIQGLNGRLGRLVTVWQIDQNREVPRLVTNWLEVYQDLT
jgi:HAMP domain-containing protein